MRRIFGFVPARLRNTSDDAFVVTMNGGFGLVRSWEADIEVRNRRRDGTVPAGGNDEISSPLADGPAEDGFEDWDLTSVDALPLRFRRMYFSIALASCSRMRVAIGDSADAGFGLTPRDVVEWEGRGECPVAEKVLMLLAEYVP